MFNFKYGKVKAYIQRHPCLFRMLDLVKSKTKDLVLLEAFAGQIPTWIVNKKDEPTWLPSAEDPWISKCKYVADFLCPKQV